MVRDLSETHGLVGKLFQKPATRRDWDRFRLSPEVLEGYRARGYVSGIRVLDDLQVEALREELQGLMDPSHPGHGLFHEFHSNESKDPSRVLCHALGGWRIAIGFHDLLWNPAILMPAHQILGGAVRFWHDQIFSKPAHHGGVVAWHQDYSYWTRTKPMAHLTCWIGLDDSTVENGCLQYIPGSHRWKLLPITGLAGDMESIHSVLSPEEEEQFRPVPIELGKGEASFHHPLLIHGSYENRSPRPRRAVVINLFSDGVSSDSDAPLLAGTPSIAKGRPMGGQFFPLLYDARDS